MVNALTRGSAPYLGGEGSDEYRTGTLGTGSRAARESAAVNLCARRTALGGRTRMRS